MIEYKEIDIDKIKVIGNIRTDTNDLSMPSLMESINQHGLLEPIGIFKEENEYVLAYGHRRLEAFKKLGMHRIPSLISSEKLTEKEFITINATENFNRKDIQPIELGRIVSRLIELGLNKSEIVSRLSLSKSIIENSLSIFNKTPMAYRSRIGYGQFNKNKYGKLPMTTANKIASMDVSKSKIEDLFDYAIKEEPTIDQLKLIIDILHRSNVSVEDAAKLSDKYRSVTFHIIVNKVILEELIDIHKESINKIMIKMLMGKIPYKERLLLLPK